MRPHEIWSRSNSVFLSFHTSETPLIQIVEQHVRLDADWAGGRIYATGHAALAARGVYVSHLALPATKNSALATTTRRPMVANASALESNFLKPTLYYYVYVVALANVSIFPTITSLYVCYIIFFFGWSSIVFYVLYYCNWFIWLLLWLYLNLFN